jgi:PhzF family phenazine biosynthesis protein
MQNISMELGYSNSAFVVQTEANKYHIRWFTTVSEAPICGHATVATAHILATQYGTPKGTEIHFESLAGPISARIEEDGWYTLNFPAYSMESVPMSPELQAVLGAGVDPIFTGFSMNCFFVEMPNNQVLSALTLNLGLLKLLPCRALIVTSGPADNYDYYSRYFAPAVGINEDPVCASSHCRLAPYWARKLNKLEMLAYHSSTRSGKIKCKNIGNRVFISGEAVTVMVSDLMI